MNHLSSRHVTDPRHKTILVVRPHRSIPPNNKQGITRKHYLLTCLILPSKIPPTIPPCVVDAAFAYLRREFTPEIWFAVYTTNQSVMYAPRLHACMHALGRLTNQLHMIESHMTDRIITCLVGSEITRDIHDVHQKATLICMP